MGWLIFAGYCIVGLSVYYLLARFRCSVLSFLFDSDDEDTIGMALCFFSLFWFLTVPIIIFTLIVCGVLILFEHILTPIRKLAESHANKYDRS